MFCRMYTLAPSASTTQATLKFIYRRQVQFCRMITMQHDVLMFDLDGTLSDPLPGIAACINHALQHLGYEIQPEAALARFVGPPLQHSFREITGCDKTSTISALIMKYRERYQETGYAENQIYDGVEGSLQTLHDAGAEMLICTSKPVYLAEKVLRHFGLEHYFSFISGGDIGVEKWQQIAMLKQQGKVTTRSLMIGDRAVDLTAAHHHSLSSAAVLWGYGSLHELQQEYPRYYFSHPQEWYQLLDC